MLLLSYHFLEMARFWPSVRKMEEWQLGNFLLWNCPISNWVMGKLKPALYPTTLWMWFQGYQLQLSICLCFSRHNMCTNPTLRQLKTAAQEHSMAESYRVELSKHHLTKNMTADRLTVTRAERGDDFLDRLSNWRKRGRNVRT